jgi:hypothetical protein
MIMFKHTLKRFEATRADEPGSEAWGATSMLLYLMQPSLPTPSELAESPNSIHRHCQLYCVAAQTHFDKMRDTIGSLLLTEKLRALYTFRELLGIPRFTRGH